MRLRYDGFDAFDTVVSEFAVSYIASWYTSEFGNSKAQSNSNQ